MKIGWYLAQADSRDNFVTDPVGYSDFASNLSEHISHIIEQIQSERYRPRYLIDIDIPKSRLSVRPGNVIPIEEAVILHGIVYLFAPLLDKKLNSSVFSYRLRSDWKKNGKKQEINFSRRKNKVSISEKENHQN